MHDFRKLNVWHDSVELAVAIYKTTAKFPSDERFGLTSQMRSAAVSIGSNIAEGAGRGGSKEMARFLRIALGSISELEAQLEVASRLGLVEAGSSDKLGVGTLRRRVLRLHDTIAGTRP